MVCNEKNNTINCSAHETMVLITSASGKGSDESACTHDLARAFASRINKVCKLKKAPNNFETSSLSGHTRMSDYKKLFGYAIRPNLMFVSPFFMVQILNPCPA